MEFASASAAHGITRRSLFRRGAGVGAVVGAAALAGDVWLDAPWAYADVTTVGLGSGTAPEQVHLTWGNDPTSAVTVSWSSPKGMPKASLTYSTAGPISAANPGTAASVARVNYQDGMNLELVYNFHAKLTGLAANTTYYYLISDGAATPSTLAAQFTTAPAGRAPFVFSSFGDLGTPGSDKSASGYEWQESSDNAYYAVQELEKYKPLFHLLNGDLCYANLNFNNQPEVWRDFAINNQYSAKNRPWMPCLGNHEIEFGQTSVTGSSVADGNGGWNGAYGYLAYQSRYQLPANNVTGFQGNFYSFTVGTVLFVSLDADDVIYQDGGALYTPTGTASQPQPGPLTASSNDNISIPAGTTNYNREYTGGLIIGPNNTLVPGADSSSTATGPNSGNPNLQTQWLTGVLSAARAANSGIDMIVVQIHQCPLSSSATGNGSDLGLRQTWLPIFDNYSVDIVVNGHDHDYERTFAVRGYDPTPRGTVVSQTTMNPGQSAGATVDTRLPLVVPTAGPFTATLGAPTYSVNNGTYAQTFDTSQGTVFLTLGGGGTNGPTQVYNSYTTGPYAGQRQGKVITQRNVVVKSTNASTGIVSYAKPGADSIEPTAWSAQTDKLAYGFAIFTVDPGKAAGQTTIRMDYYHAGTIGSSPTNTATNGGDSRTSLGGNGFEGGPNGNTSPAADVNGYSLYETVLYGRTVTPNVTPSLPEFGAPAMAAIAGLAVGGAALVAAKRRGEQNAV